MLELNTKQKRTIKIIIAYPFVILAISILVNLLLPKAAIFEAVFPSSSHLWAVIIAGILLVLNHSLLMTTTEITRVKYKMYATPEEWKANGRSWGEVPESAVRELERNHNAHRNSTENTCYFILLAIPFLLLDPPMITAYLWLLGFSISRIGHTISYLKGWDNLRGVFMSVGLVCLYGVAGYMVLAGLLGGG